MVNVDTFAVYVVTLIRMSSKQRPSSFFRFGVSKPSSTRGAMDYRPVGAPVDVNHRPIVVGDAETDGVLGRCLVDTSATASIIPSDLVSRPNEMVLPGPSTKLGIISGQTWNILGTCDLKAQLSPWLVTHGFLAADIYTDTTMEADFLARKQTL